jgi:hypothetical protein
LTHVLDINRYALYSQIQSYEQIYTYGQIYTDLSGYVPYMHRYGHIWVEPGRSWVDLGTS